MPQLDQLIQILVKHNAEALILQSGQKPALLMDGAERSIVKTALAGGQVSQLAAEIAPAEERGTVAGGGSSSFTYEMAGSPFQVEVEIGPKVVIRAATANAPAPTPTPAEPAVETAAAPEPEPAPEPETAPATATAPTATAAATAATGGQTSVRGLTMDGLLRQLFDLGGSDLHLSSGARPSFP